MSAVITVRKNLSQGDKIIQLCRHLCCRRLLRTYFLGTLNVKACEINKSQLTVASGEKEYWNAGKSLGACHWYGCREPRAWRWPTLRIFLGLPGDRSAGRASKPKVPRVKSGSAVSAGVMNVDSSFKSWEPVNRTCTVQFTPVLALWIVWLWLVHALCGRLALGPLGPRLWFSNLAACWNNPRELYEVPMSGSYLQRFWFTSHI